MKDIERNIDIITANLILLGEYELSGGASGSDSMVKDLDEWQGILEEIDNIIRG